MKKIINIIFIVAVIGLPSSCIKETDPMGGTVTSEQAAKVPTAVLSFAAGMDAYLTNLNTLQRFNAQGQIQFHWDFGYPALMIMRDAMGQDMRITPNTYQHFTWWYEPSFYLGPDYVFPQLPWRWGFRMIFQANTVISLVPKPEEASDNIVAALGKAYLYRAFAYFDLGRLYLAGSYANNPQGLTIPIVTFETVDVANNPRVPAADLYTFILEDLDLAEQYLANAPTHQKSTPTLPAVYGMKARVYLEIGEWAEAEKYAKLAKAGFTPLTSAQWMDPINGFNTPVGNDSWIWCAELPIPRSNLINWTAWMAPENEYGYAGPVAMAYLSVIDRCLYDQIPAADFRKNSFVPPGATGASLATISNAPLATRNRLANVPYISVKFRVGGGNYGTWATGNIASVPLMRVEEMYLIEAEAAARQDVGRGRALLNAFVQTYRDATYNSTAGSTDFLINDIWLQRRIELWGEGFATFDIKRLNKGITRNYPGTNHAVGFRFNTDNQPTWMNYCITRGEFLNNFAIDPGQNNPAPTTPPDSPVGVCN